jgi:hypothetical protein
LVFCTCHFGMCLSFICSISSGMSLGLHRIAAHAILALGL